MRRVRCPECDTKVKVPDDHERSYIRCSECDKKIRLDEDDDEDDKPKQSSSSIRKKKSKQKNEYLSFLPLLLIFPLLLCPVLAYLHRIGAAVGLLFGLVVAITAFVMGHVIAKRKGLTTIDDMPWIVQRMPIVQLFFQFQYAFHYPREIGPWVAVSVLATVVAIASGVLGEGRAAMESRRAHQEIADRQVNFKPPEKDKNVGGNPWQEKNPPQDNPPPFNKQPKNDQPFAPQVTGDAGLDSLLADMDSKNPFVAEKAAKTLAAMQPNQHQATVAKGLAERTLRAGEIQRDSFILALGTWATPAEVPALIQIVNTNAISGLRPAFDALGRLKDERALPALMRHLKSPLNREPVANALRQYGPAAENALLPLLYDKDFFMRQAAANTLKDIGTQQSLPALQKIAASNDPFLNRQAQEAVNAIQARTKK
jgi:hypothetical protein